MNDLIRQLKKDFAAFNGGSVYDYRFLIAEKFGLGYIISKLPIRNEVIDSLQEKYNELFREFGIIIDYTLVNPREVRYDEF